MKQKQTKQKQTSAVAWWLVELACSTRWAKHNEAEGGQLDAGSGDVEVGCLDRFAHVMNMSPRFVLNKFVVETRTHT